MIITVNHPKIDYKSKDTANLAFILEKVYLHTMSNPHLE